MAFRYFTSDQWAKVPEEQKRKESHTVMMGGRLVTRQLWHYLENGQGDTGRNK